MRGVFVDFNLLSESIHLKKLANQSANVDAQLSFSMCRKRLDPTQWFVAPSDDFVYTQILIDCLLQLESTVNDRNALLSLCEREYKSNPRELKAIAEFRRSYMPSQALRWFTRNAFVSNILKRALNSQDIIILILLRFFLSDSERQLNENRCTSRMRVYRSQSIPANQLELLKDSLGDFISINGFLSTLPNRQMALLLLGESSGSDGSTQVLFEIDADPSVTGAKSFSNVPLPNETSEVEILFSLGATFQLNNVVQGEEGIWLVQMTLCSTEDTQISAVCEYLQNQSTDEISSPLLLGVVLQRLNRFEQAEEYYHKLYDIFSGDEKKRAQCSAAWEIFKRQRTNWQTNLAAAAQCEGVRTQRPVSDDFQYASNYTHRGDYFRQKGDFLKALESFRLALAIWKTNLTDNHPEVGRCLTHIGSIHQQRKEFEQALVHYQNALRIFEQHLSSDHPELKVVYRNLTDICRSLHMFEEALEHFRKWQAKSETT